MLVVPIAEEVLTVEKHVEDGRHVRVRTVVENRDEVIQETVQRGEVRLHCLVETESVEIPETRRVMRAVVEDVSADQQQQGN